MMASLASRMEEEELINVDYSGGQKSSPSSTPNVEADADHDFVKALEASREDLSE
jgi:hypothetical protein